MTEPFTIVEVPFGKKKLIITKLFNLLIKENLSIVIFVKNAGLLSCFSNKNINIYKSFSSGSIYLIDNQEKLKEGIAFFIRQNWHPSYCELYIGDNKLPTLIKEWASKTKNPYEISSSFKDNILSFVELLDNDLRFYDNNNDRIKEIILKKFPETHI